MNQLFSILMLIVIAMPAVAATRTVTLSVPGMNCAACPITVKKALGNVPGVSRTEVSLDRREATGIISAVTAGFCMKPDIMPATSESSRINRSSAPCARR